MAGYYVYFGLKNIFIRVQLPVAAGQLAAVVGALRAGHVRGRGGGGGGGGRRAARVRGVLVLRQERGRAAQPRAAAARLRQAAAARQQDEGTETPSFPLGSIYTTAEWNGNEVLQRHFT